MSNSKHTPTRRDNLHSFRHDKERGLKRKRLFIILGFFALLLILLRSPAEHYLASTFHFILRPFYVSKLMLNDGASTYSYLVSSKASLAKENLRLKDALDAIVVESYAQKTLRAENDYLKNVFYRHPERSFMLARVLASPGAIPYDTLIIDIGTDAGLLPGVRVFSDGDFILGEVSQVFKHSAVVTLYSSSGNELSVQFGATATPVTAYGVGGGNFRIILPKGVLVEIGDIIEVPELAPTFLGIVEGVEKSESSSLQDIYFRWPFNVSALRFVYIEVEVERDMEAESTTP